MGRKNQKLRFKMLLTVTSSDHQNKQHYSSVFSLEMEEENQPNLKHPKKTPSAPVLRSYVGIKSLENVCTSIPDTPFLYSRHSVS